MSDALRIIAAMDDVFLGSEALRRGAITRGQLRWNYRTIFPDVYQSKAVQPSTHSYTVGAWLWSKRRAVITGRAASALHGALWVDSNTPIELLWRNWNPPPGIITRDERFTCDDVVDIDHMAVATVQRAAFDIGRHLRRDAAVTHLDALARATGLTTEHVLPLLDQHKGARGVRRLKTALDLMDAGAQSPKETWLRLLLIDAGFPRPRTQIPVFDERGDPFAYLDMGWDDVLIAVEYDGDQHRTDRVRYAWDVKRLRKIERAGWLHVKVISEDCKYDIIERVKQAWTQRQTTARAANRTA
ncbi:MAG: hypothetical protein QOD59_598 [Mycobacterium sp.]|jgi:hypothetical protein|nr:hypothetical protein [Mycobacterium sp.]MDT7791162.1 hypothetical protein [Mycobacterium sp.]